MILTLNMILENKSYNQIIKIINPILNKLNNYKIIMANFILNLNSKTYLKTKTLSTKFSQIMLIKNKIIKKKLANRILKTQKNRKKMKKYSQKKNKKTIKRKKFQKTKTQFIFKVLQIAILHNSLIIYLPKSITTIKSLQIQTKIIIIKRIPF